MRRYEDRVIWAHGSRFVVRKLPRSYATHDGLMRNRRPDWRVPERRNIMHPYAVFGPNGEFARVPHRWVSTWINHFALTRLVS